MLKIILTSFLISNAIFWGIYPVSNISPHQKIGSFLNISITKYFHIGLGTFFFFIGCLLAHEKNIN